MRSSISAGEVNTGDFELSSNFLCGGVNEPWASLDLYHKSRAVPPGNPQAGKVNWANDQYSALVDQIATLPLGDPEVHRLFRQAAEIWVEELPAVPIAQGSNLIPFNTTYWKGWPTADDFYAPPLNWAMQFHKVVHRLEPAQ